MKKIIIILISMVLLTGCQSIDKDQLKSDLKQEIKSELIEELSNDYLNIDEHLQEITSIIKSYTVAIKIEISSSVSIGSGIIIKQDDNSYQILTNEHVIRYADKIEVYIPSLNKYFEATLEKENTNEDLAIISITTTDILSVYTVTDIEYSVGQLVLAVGTATSLDFANTVTLGIISNITDERIQHDAAINTGNSGGPLFTINGMLIGLNVSKINSTTVGNSIINVEGMGFCIPIEKVLLFLDE